MQIVINGQSKSVDDSAKLAAVLDDFGVPERGVAVAVNGSVVPRASWPETDLRADSNIEILSAVQGG